MENNIKTHIDTHFTKQNKVNEYIVSIVNRLLQLIDQLLAKTNKIMLFVMRLNEKQS